MKRLTIDRLASWGTVLGAVSVAYLMLKYPPR